MITNTICLIVMGVSGSGKSHIAHLLAEQLNCPMSDGDEFHPSINIEKMSAGTALTDADRIPWLLAIRDWISTCHRDGHNAVTTCSALKRSYRNILREAPARVYFIHLTGTREVISRRLHIRPEHFMAHSLLESQFDTLEPLDMDEDGITVNIDDNAQRIVDSALSRLNLG